ncbi:BRO family protein [Brevibacillus choshinensis]|nr:BRO family protein [Brevibacillus choshinensis]
MNQIQIFENVEFGHIRLIKIDSKLYAVGNDVAKSLGYVRPYEAVTTHCKGAVTYRVLTGGGEQDVKAIPEGDIYRLIVKAADQSKNPEIKEKAERYERWVFDEVLPSIRKTGVYAAEQNKVVALSERQALVQSLKLTAELAEEMDEVKSITQTHGQKLIELEQKVDEQITIDHGEQRQLQKAISRRVYEVERDPQQRSELFRQLHREIKDRWAVASYRDVRRIELRQVLRYIDAWMPRRTA